MYDGVKIQNLSVLVKPLLANDRLLFPLLVDEQTGAVLTDRPRRACDQGLSFTLTPSKAGLRCELQGSLHRYHNHGYDNANDFTVVDLLATIKELVTNYGIDPFGSKLNNIEFGVNVQLPFPVSQILNNLISYKHRPFVRVRKSGDGYAYYQAVTQRYVVKVYDKGAQYNLPGHILRFELKVLKMEYLSRQGVYLNSLADLLVVEHHKKLGTLLVDTFNEILFDDPTINTDRLTPRQQSLYQKGCNPRFWSIPDDLTTRQYNACRQYLHRTEKNFRNLLHRHHQGNDWQRETAALISETWDRLTKLTPDIVTQINDCWVAWGTTLTTDKKCHKLTGVSKSKSDRETHLQTPGRCHKLTGSNGDSPKVKMSQINPLYVVLNCDNDTNRLPDLSTARGTPVSYPLVSNPEVHAEKPFPNEEPVRCEHAVAVAAATASTGEVGRDLVRPTASMLRADTALLAKVEKCQRQYKKGSKEDRPQRAAHNLRNSDSNPRNNLARRVRRSIMQCVGMPLLLFPPTTVIRLTPEQWVLLDHWKDTSHEIRIE